MSKSSSTKNSVRILPESLINKIAAGEVVERPASVVKELLENAIDAGATEVQVSIKNGGKDLISILDNGCGMNESDAQLAVERHATSKIIDEEDLFRIRTLGFRGEADMRFVDTINVTEDATIASKVKEYEKFLSSELDIAIGKTNTELDSRKKTVRLGEAAIGNLIADVMRDGVDADVGYANGGGIRGKKIYAPGTTITRRDILSEMPFGNVVVKLELTGAQIWDALENGLSQIENNAGRFPQVSGMSFTYNPKAKAGARVVSVKIGSQSLNKGRTYTMATNNYIAGGGDGYSVFKKAKVIIDASGATIMAGMVMDYIKAKGSVSPKVEGRIVAQ